MAIALSVNGETYTVDVNEQMPLLWVLRDVLNLTGTKFGCGVGQCGACTVMVGHEAVRSCMLPVALLEGRPVKTVESRAQRSLQELQRTWISHQVPQCGYCQSGMLMAAVGLLEKNANPTQADIARDITNICRCGTYPRIERAILEAAETLRVSAP